MALAWQGAYRRAKESWLERGGDFGQTSIPTGESGMLIHAMAQWKVERRGGGCAACEKVFTQGETIQSMLEVGGEGLLRQDYCVPCWKAGRAGEGLTSAGQALGEPDPDLEPEGALQKEGETAANDRFWWSSRHQEVVEKSVRMDMEVLEQLFDALSPRKEVRLLEIRYVVCLLLLRKRRLKVTRVVREQGSEAFLVKKPRRDELHRVEVYDFTPKRMESLRHELQALLDGAGADEDPQVQLDLAASFEEADDGASVAAEIEPGAEPSGPIPDEGT